MQSKAPQMFRGCLATPLGFLEYTCPEHFGKIVKKIRGEEADIVSYSHCLLPSQLTARTHHRCSFKKLSESADQLYLKYL